MKLHFFIHSNKWLTVLSDFEAPEVKKKKKVDYLFSAQHSNRTAIDIKLIPIYLSNTLKNQIGGARR